MFMKRIEDMTIEEKWEAVEEVIREDKLHGFGFQNDPTEDLSSEIDYDDYVEL